MTYRIWLGALGAGNLVAALSVGSAWNGGIAAAAALVLFVKRGDLS